MKKEEVIEFFKSKGVTVTYQVRSGYPLIVIISKHGFFFWKFKWPRVSRDFLLFRPLFCDCEIHYKVGIW